MASQLGKDKAHLGMVFDVVAVVVVAAGFVVIAVVLHSIFTNLLTH
jgi:hypothetical protein